MKKIILCFLSIIFLVSCQHDKETNASLPVLTLKTNRIQIPLDSTFSYSSYILTASDKNDGNLTTQVTFNEINTHQLGSQTINYRLKNSHNQTVYKTLTVDVVKYYNEFFDPSNVLADYVDNPDDYQVLVNKTHALNENYKPDDLESVVDNDQQFLRHEANDAYTQLYNDAKEKGIEIYSISAYRSYEKQTFLWQNSLKQFGIAHSCQYNAYPGRSEHQLGLAIDVSNTLNDPLTEEVANSELGNFLENDAHKYGFVLRYPSNKTIVTNYAYEPWHIRYVGKELAKELHNAHMTLEEYYN